MQTKQQIEQLLASAGVSPNKKLGQNFLIDLNLIRFLVEKADITKDDIVLEVGCGTGTLTETLAEKAGRVVVVEYDKAMWQITSNLLKDKNHVKIIHGDALRNKNAINSQAIEEIMDIRQNLKGRVMLVANLPYNIAASLMINLIVGPLTVDSMYVTIQKEVAQRMTSGPGDKLYGILSIMMESAGKVNFLKKLPPNVFWPAPKVESAMVEFIRDQEKLKRIKNLKIFRDVINLFMGHRRKMLKACTKFAIGDLEGISSWDEVFERSKVDPTLRSEKLHADDFIRLANMCSELLN